MQNVPVIRDPNQDTTDLIKCMEELEAWEQRKLAATVGDGARPRWLAPLKHVFFF